MAVTPSQKASRFLVEGLDDFSSCSASTSDPSRDRVAPPTTATGRQPCRRRRPRSTRAAPPPSSPAAMAVAASVWNPVLAVWVDSVWCVEPAPGLARAADVDATPDDGLPGG